ncbi:MAG: glycoside hydrolase family 25 protein [Ruminococcus sp.]|nr:glycoside hydrolase family 25 protein [Ruminococcus sp.]
MKKITSLFLTAIICSMTLFVGCSSDSSSSAEPKPTASTDTTVKTTGNKIQINDSTLGEIWITELDGVPQNKLNNDNFTSDSTFKYYSENGKAASLEGIDISSYSGDVDWKKVKDSGVDFVIVRIGGRGYGDEGALYTDDRALEYIDGAHNAGLKVGGYFFSQAINTEEAVEEADYVKSILGDLKLEFPVAYDWEIIKDEDARTDNVSAAEATNCARAFCDRIIEHGYKTMLYSPSRELYFKYDLSRLADIDIWYCEYSNLPTFYYQFSMWQYSSTGKVDGIDADVDMNICFTGVADYD